MKVQAIQHVPFETPAAIEDWCQKRGHELELTPIYGGCPMPDPGTYDLLVILGGPMNVYEETKHPWLPQEIIGIKDAIQAQKKVLGICLGAQMIAVALGATVVDAEHKEIGWFPIQPIRNHERESYFDSFPDSFLAFHWHGDTFHIPEGAERIAESEACPNQAFQFQHNVLGLQFHLETNSKSMLSLIEHCEDELIDAPWIQSRISMTHTEIPFQTLHNQLFTLLDKFTMADVLPGVPK